ncbi:MAG: NAD+ synthase [Bacteroidales bacterium]|jgi:NAD+ synthase (glutamine-hydrolysing)
MIIALAQLNFTIGAFDENESTIIKALNEARSNHADLVVFSELCVCGYPPLDLLEHKNFIDKCRNVIERIVSHTENLAVIIGAPTLNKKEKGKNLHNSAIFIRNRKIEKVINKTLLPTYDIFDEYRYFQPSEEHDIITFKGKKIALTICEDLWYKQPLLTNFGKNKLYTVNPVEKLDVGNCDFMINIAGSPFAYNHDKIKTDILSYNAKKYSVPIFYVNQVGAHTELIFDGASMVINSKGETVGKLNKFREEIAYFDVDKVVSSDAMKTDTSANEQIGLIHDALVMGIHDYFRKMNFTSAILGLSGGIDSAVTLVLARYALGAENVRALLMPSQYSSGHSVSDAVTLSENLGIQYDTISIRDVFSNYLSVLGPYFKDLPEDITEENIQSRIRGTLLMAFSNKFGNLLLNTSNKSEVAVGYGTLYGDMSGSLSVLGDVYKTDVYRLAKFMNRDREIIPENIITKPPSAELRPDQKDSDSLPDYDHLDKILFNYIELRMSEEEIIEGGYDESMVSQIVRKVNINEYKRYQTPPILRVSSKAFGLGRRMPLVARY